MGLKTFAGALLSVGLFAAPTAASAAVTYLDFEGIATYPNGNGVLVDNYYGGGTASNGASGPNLGVDFTAGATLICMDTPGVDCSNTSKGGVGPAASQYYAVYFPTANFTMNVAAGFDTGFSMTYSNPFAVAIGLEIWSGQNGTGTLLSTSTLAGTTNGGSGACTTGTANYCPFGVFSTTFAGTAQSVVFTGTANASVYDDFTFGSSQVGGAVPEPATWAMMIMGFGLVGASMRRRSTKVALA